MGTSKAGRAITAGMAGASAFAYPQVALAASGAGTGMVQNLLEMPHAEFVLGCATGAVAVGAAWGISSAVSHAREHSSFEAQLEGRESDADAGEFASADRGFAVEDGTSPDAYQQRYQTEGAPASQYVRHQKRGAAPADTASIPAAVPAPPQARKGAHQDDLADFAQSYVAGEEGAKRARTRSRGVRSVLAERIGKSMFEDLPVIQRADGSVGDVGTGWWDMTLGDSVRYVGEKPDASGKLSVPDWAKAEANDARQQASAAAASRSAAAAFRPKTDAQKRAAYIAKNIAEIDEGVYPAKRSAEELDHEDMWEQALEAMDQNLEREAAAPAEAQMPLDAMGTQAPSDEADVTHADESASNKTTLIPFKVPADHPEVVDTDTYVDYLIDDEFSRNRSEAARKSSRDYLRVLEGGTHVDSLRATSPLRTRQRSGRRNPARASTHATREYRPRHMAPSVSVKEA